MRVWWSSINFSTKIHSNQSLFNTRRHAFQDIRFRQAITYAYDFEWQNKALFYGQYRRLQSYFSNSELEAKGTPSAAELAVLKPFLGQAASYSTSRRIAKWQYPVTDASGFNRSGLLKARELLLKAGYRFQQVN